MTSHSIHYEIQGEGLPFLFMHGLGADHHQSQELLAPIQRVRKIMVDCPGHGNSDMKDTSTLSFELVADRMIELMDKLDFERFLVGDISMGSGISINMMVRFPDRILGGVLVRPAWLDHPHPFNLSLMEKAAQLADHPDAQKKFESLSEFQQLKQELPNAAKSLLGQFQRPQGLKATTELLYAMINDTPVKELSDLLNFKNPCCIITNQNDPLHPAFFGSRLQQFLPQASLSDVFPKYLDAKQHHSEVQEVIQQFVDHIY